METLKEIKIGDMFYHPCSIDIMEHKVTSIRHFEGFKHYILKATHNIGASGRIEVIIDEHNGKFRFVGFLNEDLVKYSSGLQDFVEGEYFISKQDARLEFYKIQRTFAWSNLEHKKRLLEEAESRYKQVQNIIKQIKN